MILSQRALEAGKGDQTFLRNSDNYQHRLAHQQIVGRDAVLSAPFCGLSNCHGLLF